VKMAHCRSTIKQGETKGEKRSAQDDGLIPLGLSPSAAPGHPLLSGAVRIDTPFWGPDYMYGGIRESQRVRSISEARSGTGRRQFWARLGRPVCLGISDFVDSISTSYELSALSPDGDSRKECKYGAGPPKFGT
jgi:hypothetical protein